MKTQTTTLPISEFKSLISPGTIILERGHGFISRQIILHMKIYAWQTGQTAAQYSHAETIILKDGRLQTTGARIHGTGITPVEDYYNKGHEICILTPRVPLNDSEIELLTRMAESYSKNAKYQFSNLVSWINRIKTFGLVNVFNNSPRRLYCYEQAARLAFISQRWPGNIPLERVSIYDLLNNPHYKIYKP